MRNSFFLLLLTFTISCGKQVTISHAKLEAYSDPTMAGNQNQQLAQQGMLLRTGIDVISLGSVSYNVSDYSSHQAKQFISSRPAGSQTPVKFKGTVKGREIVLSSIEQI